MRRSHSRFKGNLHQSKRSRAETQPRKLTGRIAALNRFISKSAEYSLPFFKALRGEDKVEWGPEQSRAFQQLKNYLATKLMVTVPDPEAPLLLYVAASNHAISGVLVQEKEEESKVIQ